MTNPFKIVMKKKSDKELLKVLEKKEDYQPDAIKAAEEEIKNRGGIEKIKDKTEKITNKGNITNAEKDYSQILRNDKEDDTPWYKKWWVILIFIYIIINIFSYAEEDLNNKKANEIIQDLKNIELSADTEDTENYGISYKGDEPQTEFMKEFLQLYEKHIGDVKELIAQHETLLAEIGNFVLEETEEYKNIEKLKSYKEKTILTKGATISYLQNLYGIIDEYNADLRSLYSKNNLDYEPYTNKTEECSGQHTIDLNEIIEITEEYYDSYVSSLDFVIQNNDTIILNGEFINFTNQRIHDQYLLIVNELVEKEDIYFATLNEVINKADECIQKVQKTIKS